jgi:hypothetical protein
VCASSCRTTTTAKTTPWWPSWTTTARGCTPSDSGPARTRARRR